MHTQFVNKTLNKVYLPYLRSGHHQPSLPHTKQVSPYTYPKLTLQISSQQSQLIEQFFTTSYLSTVIKVHMPELLLIHLPTGSCFIPTFSPLTEMLIHPSRMKLKFQFIYDMHSAFKTFSTHRNRYYRNNLLHDLVFYEEEMHEPDSHPPFNSSVENSEMGQV